MKKILFCAACGSRLTGPLTLLSGKNPEIAKPQQLDRQPLAAAGTVFKSYEPLWRSHAAIPHPLEFTPQYWIHPTDVSGSVLDTDDISRLGGCCGVSGTGEPNQICACGAEVGTLQSDCFTPWVFVANLAATGWEPAHEDTELES